MPFIEAPLNSGVSSNRLLPLAIATASAAAAATVGVWTIAKKAKYKSNDGRLHHRCEITLPDWAREELADYACKEYRTDEEMMNLAIDLSARNAAEQTGGPFGCAIFERDTESGIAKLISVGVNRVVNLSNSTLHGETVAIQLAQQKLRSFTMQIPKNGGDATIRNFELFTSCEPCAMCLGATLWSGVSRIVCAATKADAESIGFNEGPVFEASYQQLREAGIVVKKLVLQQKAAKVLEEYGRKGKIYNSSSSL